MKLADTQKLFWSLASQGPEGNEAQAKEVLRDFPPLAGTQRMRIYANMFLWRQIDVLREDFPKLTAVLGDEKFYALAEAYIAAHPSSHYSIAKLGRFLSTYLQEHLGPRVDLADLARLEWARAEIFEAPNAPSVPPSVLQQIAPEAFPELPLPIVPAVQLISLQHDALKVWRAIEDGQPAPDPIATPTFAAVWRKDFQVYHADIGPEEAEALRRAQRGEPWANVCEAFSELPDAADAAFRAVGSWFVEGWIRQQIG